MQVTADSEPRTPLFTRMRPWLVVIVATIIFALIPVVGFPLFFALPLIGLALAAGSPPDYVADAKTVARRPRNVVLGIVVVLCLVVTVLQPRLTLLLVLLFGLDAADLVVSLIAVAALALPLGMADSGKLVRDLPPSRPVFTRRNLILCLTVAVTVATWYAGPGLSYLPIAALVIGLPIPLVLSRLLATRHDRLQFGLLRNPLRGNLLPHWLQLVNMLVLCGLLACTIFTGAYDAAAFGLSRGAY